MPTRASFLTLRATAISASSSAGDSMLRNPTPARIASSSSAAVLPTPENTIASASKPAASRSSRYSTAALGCPHRRSGDAEPRLHVTDMTYSPAAIAAYFDALGAGEWERFDRTLGDRVSLALHTALLERYVRPGHRILDVGAG